MSVQIVSNSTIKAVAHGDDGCQNKNLNLAFFKYFTF